MLEFIVIEQKGFDVVVCNPVKVEQVPKDNLGHEQLEKVVSDRVLLAVVVHIYFCPTIVVLKGSIVNIV